MITTNTFYRQIYNIFTLKSLFQIIDLLFKYYVIKMFSISDIGIFLYVCSIVYFFSNLAMVGMPVYLQRQVARDDAININYMKFSLLFIVMSCIFAYLILPLQLTALKPYFLLIILCNTIISSATAICYGHGKYDSRYKILLISCIYMIVMIFYMMFQKTHYHLNVIFYAWIINSVVAMLYSIKLSWPFQKKATVVKTKEIGTIVILFDLILIYAVFMPFDYSRLYDRFLIHHFFTQDLLGIYTFNYSLILAAYSFLIMPIYGICMTAFSKASLNIEEQAKVLLRFYLYIFAVFILLFVGYVPFSLNWLHLLGLQKYIGSTYIFIAIYAYLFLYALSVPFTIIISIADNNRLKLVYSMLSLLIFTLPALFIAIDSQFTVFLFGFLLAFFVHLLLSIFVNYSYSKKLLYWLGREVAFLMKNGRAGFLALIVNK